MRQTMLVFLVIGAFLPGVALATAEEEALALEGRKLDFEREMHELELQEHQAQIERPQRGPYHHKQKRGGIVWLIRLIIIIVHVLATIWVCGDLQRRKMGSGLWIPIVLLSGLLGLLVYAVIRLGDMQQTQTATV